MVKNIFKILKICKKNLKRQNIFKNILADQPLVILEQIPGGYGGETTDGGYSYQSVEVGNELMFDANGQQMILIIPGEGYADQEQPAE